MATALESSLRVAPSEKKVATAAPTLRKSKSTAAAAGPKASRWLASFSIDNIALLLFSCIFLLHLGALSLFTRGFLLKRTTLEARNECDPSSKSCVLEPKFDRAVILLVDALRYDFLFPIDPASAKFDAAHHNHLAVPIALSTISPAHSIMYKSIADPPTTTLQRLKAITTGSLPTFIDAGSNFAGSRVDEDNWLEQANRVGKRIAFMGDDTWLTIFPEEVFAPNHSFPFDSFNVEDLDTVDAGVRQHIIPLLDQSPDTSSWDILIAHPLGLDHAGHRFGASHAQTTRKLRETNALIEQIVERLAEKDLLIVTGDHGMDSKGDHGGSLPWPGSRNACRD
jgi:phosphatidylinositol glycan class O